MFVLCFLFSSEIRALFEAETGRSMTVQKVMRKVRDERSRRGLVRDAHRRYKEAMTRTGGGPPPKTPPPIDWTDSEGELDPGAAKDMQLQFLTQGAGMVRMGTPPKKVMVDPMKWELCFMSQWGNPFEKTYLVFSSEIRRSNVYNLYKVHWD